MRALLLGFLLSPALQADNQAGTAYLVLFWPAATLCILLLASLTVYNLRSLYRKQYRRGSLAAAVCTLLVAATAMSVFPLFLHGNPFPSLARKTIIPLAIASGLTVPWALWLMIRCIEANRRIDRRTEAPTQGGRSESRSGAGSGMAAAANETVQQSDRPEA